MSQASPKDVASSTPSPEVLFAAREIAQELRAEERERERSAAVDAAATRWLRANAYASDIVDDSGDFRLTDAGGKWLDARGAVTAESLMEDGWVTREYERRVTARLADLNGEIRAYYINHEGIGRVRHLRPLSLRRGSTQWHPEEGLLIRCIDLETGQEREFSDAFTGSPGLTEVIGLAVRAGQNSTPCYGVQCGGPGAPEEDLCSNCRAALLLVPGPSDASPSKGAIIWDFCERIAKRALELEATAGGSIPADCLVDAVIAIVNFRAGWIGAEELAAARQGAAALARDGNALAAVVCAAAGGQAANASNAAATHAARIYSEDMGRGEQIAQLEDLLAILEGQR